MSLFSLKKNFWGINTTFVTFFFCCIHPWPEHLTILRDTKTNNLICLIGDYHADNAKEKQEANAISIMKKPLQNILNKGNVACLIEAEPGRFETIIKEKTKEFNNIYKKKFISKYVNNLSFINQLSSKLGYNSSAIIPADWRTDEISTFILFYANTIPNISEDFYEKILKKMKEKKLVTLYQKSKKQGLKKFMIDFFKEEGRKKMLESGLEKVVDYYESFINDLMEAAQEKSITFKNVIMMINKQIERVEQAEDYAPELSKALVKNLTNILEIIKRNAQIFGEDKLYFSYDMNNALKNQDFMQLVETSQKGTLQKLLKNNLTDFGYIVEIEKARKKFPIILLYVGENHSKYIQDYYYLNKKEYDIVFEIENNNDKLPEKKDFIKFFNIIQEESGVISLKKEKEKELKEKKI